ncbi:hypothetical protein Dimus_006397, partial [Dionaea muscipula]
EMTECEGIGLDAEGNAFFLSEVEDLTGAGSSAAAGHFGTPLGHTTSFAELLGDDTYDIPSSQSGALSRQEQEFRALERAGFDFKEGELSTASGGSGAMGQQLGDDETV